MPFTAAARRVAAGDGRCAQSKEALKDASRFSYNGKLPDIPWKDRIKSLENKNLSPKKVRKLILEGRYIENVEWQEEAVSLAMKTHILNGQEPKWQQVQALRRLVYRLGDCILIAKTGFGKSAVFHALSYLTGEVTIQLIPLSRLGLEQLGAIKRLKGSRPVLVTAETKLANRGLFDEIRTGKYTHILLGPEQAASPEFREILQDPKFKKKLGLVAIDELHVLDQWAKFRPEMVLVHEMRRSLLSTTMFFGCLATLDKTLRNVIRYGGFKEESTDPGGLCVMRTSIDRPDIALCALPIPSRQRASFRQPYFLLDRAVLWSSRNDIAADEFWADGIDPFAEPIRGPEPQLMLADRGDTAVAVDLGSRCPHQHRQLSVCESCGECATLASSITSVRPSPSLLSSSTSTFALSSMPSSLPSTQREVYWTAASPGEKQLDVMATPLES